MGFELFCVGIVLTAIVAVLTLLFGFIIVGRECDENQYEKAIIAAWIISCFALGFAMVFILYY